ncbi:MAG: DegQ family serine endoprotease [Pseudomonadales bacterium]|nr:DegQ family serine endoprotease [Pseudomonadales bacterium]
MKMTHGCFPGVLLAAFLVLGGLADNVLADVDPRPSVSAMLEHVTPAVVNIAVTGTVDIPQNPLFNDPNFRRFFGVPEQPESRQTQSVGSGVIIDADKGYILTNHHVIENADSIEVTLKDRRRVSATLIGSDAGTDIALLQIDADNLQAITLSDSDTLKVGDFVVAIGDPFGIGQTVTSGIVSALGRSGINAENYEDFIQTDASINPGNSGGALVDYNGELIGINTAIIAPAGGNVGIGFAVPVNMAKAVVDQLIEYGEVSRGLLGVLVQDLTPDLVKALDLKVYNGAVVSSVTPDSAAEKAGIEAGDVIIKLNHAGVDGSSDLRNRIALMRAGTRINLTVLRDGRELELDAVTGGAPQLASAASETASAAVLQGAEFSNIPSSHPAAGKVAGVLVTAVAQGGRAWNNGLREGDIILSVNRRAVKDRSELAAILKESQGTLALNILRDERSLFLIVR